MQLLQVAINKLLEKQQEFAIILNPPASGATIAAFEATFKVLLPTSIRAFYEQHNGFETCDELFRLLPLEEISRELTTYGNGREGQQFVLAEYMIYSDSWDVFLTRESASGYYIINTDHGTDKPVILTEFLTDFLLRYLDGGGVFGPQGLYEWRNEAAKIRPRLGD